MRSSRKAPLKDLLSAEMHARLKSDLERQAGEAARETVAGAALCGGLDENLALLLELEQSTDQTPRLPGTRATALVYALEGGDLPFVARLTSESFAGRAYARLEVFQRVEATWHGIGHAVLEISAAHEIAREILRIPAEPPTPAEVVH